MNKEQFIKSSPEGYQNEDFYDICRSATLLGIHGDKHLIDGGIYIAFIDNEFFGLSAAIKKYIEKHQVKPEELFKNIKIRQLNTLVEADGPCFYLKRNDGEKFSRLFNFAEIPNDVLVKLFSEAGFNIE